MGRLEELSGLLSLRALLMAQTSPTAIMLSVSHIVSYIRMTAVYLGLKERLYKALFE